MVVKIKKSAYEGMIEHAEEGYPNEICGVMIGKEKSITEFRRCKNIVAEDSIKTSFKDLNNIDKNRTSDRYELDPLSYLQADEWARENGLEILGIYHSHPDHPSKPSETDRQVASPGWGYIIFSISSGKYSDARIWYIREKDHQFEQRDFEIFD